jgi:hypothetical protein
MENLKLRIYGIRASKKQFLMIEGIFLLVFMRAFVFSLLYYFKTNNKDPDHLRKIKYAIYMFDF